MRTIEQRLLARTKEDLEVTSPHVDTPCWTCSYSLAGGYPQIGGGDESATHRVAYSLWKGPIPKGICVCHKCDRKRCINPEHLWLGTNNENLLDRDRKGRQAKGGEHSAVMKVVASRGIAHSKIMKRVAARDDRNAMAREEVRAKVRGNKNGTKTCPDKVKKGESLWSAKLKEQDVRDIRSYYGQGCRIVDIVAFTKFPYQTVDKVCRGYTWRHVA